MNNFSINENGFFKKWQKVKSPNSPSDSVIYYLSSVCEKVNSELVNRHAFWVAYQRLCLD